jgi:hypothetical protein
MVGKIKVSLKYAKNKLSLSCVRLYSAENGKIKVSF